MEDIEHCRNGSVCGCPEWWGLCLDPTDSTASVNGVCPFSSPVSPKAAKEPEDLICFFWYHYGVCKRPKWKRPCPYKHRLIPSGAVQTPRGTIRHNRPCNLPLCPLRTDTEKSNFIEPEQTREPSRPRREPLDRQRSGRVTRTCFFWYHGSNCAKRPCGFHHRVSPSSCVVPPPGYVHPGPCYLPLCPLSEPLFRQDSATNPRSKSTKALRKQRYRERKKLEKLGRAPSTPVQKPRNSDRCKDLSRPLISLHGRRADSPTIRPSSSPESGELFSDEEPPDEAWFLEGFPDELPQAEQNRVAQVGDVVEVMRWEVETSEAGGQAGLTREEIVTGEEARVGGQELAEAEERQVGGNETGEQGLAGSVFESLWAAIGGK